MKHLYVIGNGFDCHHRINSSYNSFYKFLLEYHSDLLCEVDDILGDCHIDWWSDFENKLGELNIYFVAGKIADENRPDLSSDHCDRTWNDAEIETDKILEDLFERVIGTFHEWILQLNKPVPELRLNIETVNSIFLTFNYTKTLENLYGVNPRNILHIHGCVDDLYDGNTEEFILGHGKNKSEIEALNDYDPTIPKGLSDEDLHEYLMETAANVEFHEQLARDAAVSQLSRLRKPVERIIQSKISFFECLSDIDIVHVYGFSFSQIDEPYMAKIAVKLNNVEWEISDYNNSNYNKILDFVSRYNIPAFKIINLEDIIDRRQLKFDF